MSSDVIPPPSSNCPKCGDFYSPNVTILNPCCHVLLCSKCDGKYDYLPQAETTTKSPTCTKCANVVNGFIQVPRDKCNICDVCNRGFSSIQVIDAHKKVGMCTGGKTPVVKRKAKVVKESDDSWLD